MGWLTGVRVVLGLGTCAGFPAAMAVLRHHADALGGPGGSPPAGGRGSAPENTEASGQGVPARVLSVLSMSAQTVMVISALLLVVTVADRGLRAARA